MWYSRVEYRSDSKTERYRMPHQRESANSTLPLGAALPDFSLPATDGRTISSHDLVGARALIVAFTCNHCPYVKGSEEALIRLVQRFTPEGLRCVAISSNDAQQYPEDSFDKMKEKSATMRLPYPYLYDEGQQVARLFDAVCTPEFFLFDSQGRLVYHGAINDSPRDPTKVTCDFLGTAVAQVMAGRAAEPSYVAPLGCSIKWRR